MILLIDNYDSFVFNLARYVGQLSYERTLYRHDQISIEEIERMNPSHIIISPGPCTPDKAGISLEAISHFAGKIPILGICLGHQAIGQAFGGVVTKARKPMHGMSCKIKHNQKSILKNLKNPLEVGLYHSLVVDLHSLPSCLEVTAYSDENEIMALQHKEYPVYGVQFHPESILTEQGYELLRNFLEI